MPTCEICGKEVKKLYLVYVEGSKLYACEECAKGLEKQAIVENKNNISIEKKNPEEREVIENYGEVIRKAREKLGIDRKVLAEKISEKENILARIERNELIPDDKIIKKLEKELGIKLYEDEVG